MTLSPVQLVVNWPVFTINISYASRSFVVTLIKRCTFPVLLYPTAGDIFADFDLVVHQQLVMHTSAIINATAILVAIKIHYKQHI